jgi:hypothetical protein
MEKKLIDFLCMGILGCIFAKIIEWAFQIGSGIFFQLTPMTLIYQLLVAIILGSVLSIGIYFWNKKLFLVPILFYFIKEVFNWVIAPLYAGTFVGISLASWFALIIEPLFIGSIAGILISLIYEKIKNWWILATILIALIIGLVLYFGMADIIKCQLEGGFWNSFYRCCCPAGCPTSPPANWAVLYPQCTCCYLV